jgi:MYXO-CTERM domain-containing protein
MTRLLTCSTLAVLSLLLVPRLASAGCPSASSEGCDMAQAADAWLDPDPGCVVVTFEENDCTCSNEMTVTNNCADDLVAVDFTWCRWDYEEDCPTTIAAGTSGNLFIPRPGADALGDQTAALTVQFGGTDHTLNLQYEMVNVRTGGCQIALSGGSSSPVGLGLLLLGGAFALRRRRR